MTTLQQIIDDPNNPRLTFDQLNEDKGLVKEIQIRLANLGFYPGGGWIDGLIVNTNSFSWKGLTEFCNRVGGVTIPSRSVAIDRSIAQKLRDTKQIPSILNDAANTNNILEKLKQIQKNSPIVNTQAGISSAFVARTINNSPFPASIGKYPKNLEQRPDGINIAFADASSSRVDYPSRGNKPTIDGTGLNFLPSDISHACVCVGSFIDSNNPIKVRWFGKNSLDSVTLWWSTTKFIGVLNTVCKIGEQSPDTDLENCVIQSPRSNFLALVKDMVTYQGKSSNAIGALFKSFTKKRVLSDWIEAQTGSANVNFIGRYGEDPLISPATIKDLSDNSFSLRSTSGDNTDGKSNQLSAYDLVRLISMFGWHPHLAPESQLPSAKWGNLQSIAQAMGNDTARYVDVALETLGLVNVISEPVIISKVGFGNLNDSEGSMTYAAFVKFVDRRTTPGKLRTFALSLRCPSSGNDFDFRDTRIAAAVTEIIRRIVTEKLG